MRLILSKVTQPAKFIFMLVQDKSCAVCAREHSECAPDTCVHSSAFPSVWVPFLLPNYPFFGLLRRLGGQALAKGSLGLQCCKPLRQFFVTHTSTLMTLVIVFSIQFALAPVEQEPSSSPWT